MIASTPWERRGIQSASVAFIASNPSEPAASTLRMATSIAPCTGTSCSQPNVTDVNSPSNLLTAGSRLLGRTGMRNASIVLSADVIWKDRVSTQRAVAPTARNTRALASGKKKRKNNEETTSREQDGRQRIEKKRTCALSERIKRVKYQDRKNHNLSII